MSDYSQLRQPLGHVQSITRSWRHSAPESRRQQDPSGVTRTHHVDTIEVLNTKPSAQQSQSQPRAKLWSRDQHTLRNGEPAAHPRNARLTANAIKCFRYQIIAAVVYKCTTQLTPWGNTWSCSFPETKPKSAQHHDANPRTALCGPRLKHTCSRHQHHSPNRHCQDATQVYRVPLDTSSPIVTPFGVSRPLESPQTSALPILDPARETCSGNRYRKWQQRLLTSSSQGLPSSRKQASRKESCDDDLMTSLR